MNWSNWRVHGLVSPGLLPPGYPVESTPASGFVATGIAGNAAASAAAPRGRSAPSLQERRRQLTTKFKAFKRDYTSTGASAGVTGPSAEGRHEAGDDDEDDAADAASEAIEGESRDDEHEDEEELCPPAKRRCLATPCKPPPAITSSQPPSPSAGASAIPQPHMVLRDQSVSYLFGPPSYSFEVDKPGKKIRATATYRPPPRHVFAELGFEDAEIDAAMLVPTSFSFTLPIAGTINTSLPTTRRNTKDGMYSVLIFSSAATPMETL